MSKRILLLALALALMVPVAQATQSQLITSAKSHLTEIYGYTQAQADTFTFEDIGQGTLKAWQKEYPEWVYSLYYSDESAAIQLADSPFHRVFPGNFSPGEGAIRDMLNRGITEGWYQNWESGGRSAFAQAIAPYDSVRPTLQYQAGMKQSDITASQALMELFTACLGEVGERPIVADAWLDKVLAQLNLQPEKRYRLPDGQAIALESSPGMIEYYTQFQKQVPEELHAAFSYPNLQGWTCLGGAIVQQKPPRVYSADIGMVVFGQENQLLLVMLVKPSEEDWQLLPIGEYELLPGQAAQLANHTYYRNAFQLELTSVEGTIRRFRIGVSGSLDQNRFVCKLDKYQYVDPKSDTFFSALNTPQGWQLFDFADGGNEPRGGFHDGKVFAFLEAIPALNSMPSSVDAWDALPLRLIPDGYAMLSGVRLREKTSTRSKELDDFLPGTLIKDLGREEGSPAPWLKGSIGRLNGYVSTDYVNPPEGNGSISTTGTSPLPVAKTIKDSSLKTGTGLLDGKVQNLPEGSKMHVLTDEGDWLYVCVPRDELGWLMDVDGAYGYVHRNDVVIVATAIQLDWLLAE